MPEVGADRAPFSGVVSTVLVRWGKVRYIGCSNYAAWHLLKALWTADAKNLTPFVSNQVHYSLQTRDIENEIVPLAIDQGVGILVWSPIVGGLLSGKYRRGVESPAGRSPSE